MMPFAPADERGGGFGPSGSFMSPGVPQSLTPGADMSFMPGMFPIGHSPGQSPHPFGVSGGPMPRGPAGLVPTSAGGFVPGVPSPYGVVQQASPAPGMHPGHFGPHMNMGPRGFSSLGAPVHMVPPSMAARTYAEAVAASRAPAPLGSVPASHSVAQVMSTTAHTNGTEEHVHVAQKRRIEPVQRPVGIEPQRTESNVSAATSSHQTGPLAPEDAETSVVGVHRMLKSIASDRNSSTGERAAAAKASAALSLLAAGGTDVATADAGAELALSNVELPAMRISFSESGSPSRVWVNGAWSKDFGTNPMSIAQLMKHGKMLPIHHPADFFRRSSFAVAAHATRRRNWTWVSGRFLVIDIPHRRVRYVRGRERVSSCYWPSGQLRCVTSIWTSLESADNSPSGGAGSTTMIAKLDAHGAPAGTPGTESTGWANMGELQEFFEVGRLDTTLAGGSVDLDSARVPLDARVFADDPRVASAYVSDVAVSSISAHGDELCDGGVVALSLLQAKYTRDLLDKCIRGEDVRYPSPSSLSGVTIERDGHIAGWPAVGSDASGGGTSTSPPRATEALERCLRRVLAGVAGKAPRLQPLGDKTASRGMAEVDELRANGESGHEPGSEIDEVLLAIFSTERRHAAVASTAAKHGGSTDAMPLKPHPSDEFVAAGDAGASEAWLWAC